MAEDASDTNRLAGKGKRVAGTFLLMLGAGILLESTRQWSGGAIMLAGAAAFIRGLLEAGPRVTTPTRAQAAPVTPVAPVTIDPQTEGRL